MLYFLFLFSHVHFWFSLFVIGSSCFHQLHNVFHMSLFQDLNWWNYFEKNWLVECLGKEFCWISLIINDFVCPFLENKKIALVCGCAVYDVTLVIIRKRDFCDKHIPGNGLYMSFWVLELSLWVLDKTVLHPSIVLFLSGNFYAILLNYETHPLIVLFVIGNLLINSVVILVRFDTHPPIVIFISELINYFLILKFSIM